MNIINKIKKEHQTDIYKCHINTNSILDTITGTFMLGKETKPSKGKMYLNGGMYFTNSFVGKSGNYKTTLTLSMLSRMLHIHDEVEAFVYDTEGSITSPQRIIDLAGEIPNYITPKVKIEDKIFLTDKTEYDMDAFYNFLKDELIPEKEKHMKDYIKELPFIDPNTGKNMKTIVPTFVVIDSWSAMQSNAEELLLKKHNLSDSELNRVFMVDGNRKAIMIRNLATMASKYGIYFMFTAHLGKSVQMNMFDPIEKDLQYMKHGAKIKGVSDQFLFYSLNLFEARKSTPLIDNKKKALFPYFNNIATELNKVDTVVVKCKNKIAGTIIPFIVSQYSGMLSNLTNYLILNEFEFGIGGNNIHKYCDLLPNMKFTRNTLREKLDTSYELNRAFELIAQYIIIKNFWNVSKIPELQPYIKLSSAEFADILINNNSIKINDILNSRGYWTFNDNKKKDLRPYLSMIDILQLIDKK